MKKVQAKPEFHETDEYKNDLATIKNILCFSVLLLNIKLCLGLAVFSKKFRGTITIFTSAMFDMVSFLSFLYSVIIFLAISNFVIAPEGTHLVPTLINQYLAMFGNNPAMKELIDENDNTVKTRLIFYLIGSNVIVVIALNILISIVTDNYDNVQTRMNAIDQKEKASILLANEYLMIWNRDIKDKQYLFIVRYKGTDLDNLEDEWQGKMRTLKT